MSKVGRENFFFAVIKQQLDSVIALSGVIIRLSPTNNWINQNSIKIKKEPHYCGP